MSATQTAATSASAASAGTSVATGSSPSRTTVATGRPCPSPPPIRSRKATCASKYSATPPHRPRAGTVASESATCGERRLQPEGEQDDARPPSAGAGRSTTSLARAARSAPGRLGQPGLRDVDRPSRSTTTTGMRDRDPEEGGRDHARVERKSRRADPDRHDRLAERDDDDQPEALDEVLRRDAPAAHVAHEGTEVVDRQRGAPERQLRRTIEEARDHQQGRRRGWRPARSSGRRRSRSRSPRPAMAYSRRWSARTMRYATPKVTPSEPKAPGAARDTIEHRRDRGEHRQADGALLGIEGVRQPGVRGPGPPQRAEQQHAPQEAAPRSGSARGTS